MKRIIILIILLIPSIARSEFTVQKGGGGIGCTDRGQGVYGSLIFNLETGRYRLGNVIKMGQPNICYYRPIGIVLTNVESHTVNEILVWNYFDLSYELIIESCVEARQLLVRECGSEENIINWDNTSCTGVCKNSNLGPCQ